MASQTAPSRAKNYLREIEMSYFINAITQHYADFSGRARRKEFWMFYLFALCASFTAIIVDNVLGTTLGSLGYGVVYLLVGLVLCLPTLAIAVRRLHDVGKSGWFYLIILIPFIGVVWLLILVCKDGQPGENAYGSNPKEVPTSTSAPT